MAWTLIVVLLVQGGYNTPLAPATLVVPGLPTEAACEGLRGRLAGFSPYQRVHFSACAQTLPPTAKPE